MQIRAGSAVSGRFLAGKRYPKRTWSDKSRVKIGVRKTCQTFSSPRLIDHLTPVCFTRFFGSPCSTSLYRCASSPTSRRGRDLHPQSFNSQAAPLRARKSDLLVSFCRSFSCSNAYLHLSNKVPKWGVKAKVACQQWASFWQKDTQDGVIQDGVIGFLGILNKLSEMVKILFCWNLNELLPKFGCKNAQGTYDFHVIHCAFQCLWLLMEYRFLGHLRMLKDWPCKWFTCPIEIHRKLTVAKEKMKKHWLKIFVNKWYVALFTYIYTIIYIYSNILYLAYPNILLVQTQRWGKTKPSELPTWRISAGRARHSFMTHPLLRTILKAHEGPGLDQKNTTEVWGRWSCCKGRGSIYISTLDPRWQSKIHFTKICNWHCRCL